MASYDTEEDKVIIDRFKAQWATLATVPPVEYPNAPFTVPSDGTEWARLTILSGDGILADINPSSARHRYPGQAVVQVFTPRGTGSKRNSELCQKAIDAFNFYSEEGTDTAIFFGPAFRRTIGNDGDGWFQQNVIAPYRRDSLIDIT